MIDSNTVMALDVGQKRIGISTANLVTKIASPLTTISVDGTELNIIEQLIKEHEVQTLVVGMPRGLEGQETSQTEKTRKFAQELQGLGYEVHLQDEALTSVKAKEELNQRKKPYSKHEVDSLAATYILEDFLRDHYETQA